MQTIKLEVGKTYRSRKGTDVRIIAKVLDKESLYRGDNGNWYTENGRLKNYGLATIYDLIEEAPKTSRTFDIPNGAKKVTVSQEGNRIIVEIVPEAKEPKPGDIVFEDGRIMIVKKYPNLYHAMIHGNPDYLHINGSYGIPFTSATFRLATAEEAQLLFDALKKAGKRWNAETMQVEAVAERERIMDFLRSYLNNVTWSHEQLCKLVESYLKHKEGKK